MSENKDFFDCLNRERGNTFVIENDEPFIFDTNGYSSKLVVGKADLDVALERQKKYGEYFLLVTCPRDSKLPEDYIPIPPIKFPSEIELDDDLLYATVSDSAQFQNIAIAPAFIQRITKGNPKDFDKYFLGPGGPDSDIYLGDILSELLRKVYLNEETKEKNR